MSHTVLAIDTSTSLISWAVMNAGELILEHQSPERASSGLAASLHPHREILSKTDEILVGVGPGSFSGIRAAIATAQGLRSVWGCDVKAIRSSHALAWSQKHISFLGVFADARRNQYFFTGYEEGRMTRKTQVIERHEVEDYLSKCTLAVSAESDELIPNEVTLHAMDLIFYQKNFSFSDELELEPIHLRESVAKTKHPAV
ncbi:MAG: tRNA (adenosine(37)-N6)-threonylcarbamoyltransferase complex dimerization subunit type 1 TsaB [Verrucomicrobiota bacterium]